MAEVRLLSCTPKSKLWSEREKPKPLCSNQNYKKMANNQNVDQPKDNQASPNALVVNSKMPARAAAAAVASTDLKWALTSHDLIKRSTNLPLYSCNWSNHLQKLTDRTTGMGCKNCQMEFWQTKISWFWQDPQGRCTVLVGQLGEL